VLNEILGNLENRAVMLGYARRLVPCLARHTVTARHSTGVLREGSIKFFDLNTFLIVLKATNRAVEPCWLRYPAWLQAVEAVISITSQA
jgi:hypothetical protein